jgi:hypothetical protein
MIETDAEKLQESVRQAWVGIDQLVRLYALPPFDDVTAELKDRGIVIRRPRAYEKPVLVPWVREQFGKGWMGECDVSFSRDPVTTFIATHHGNLVGFATYEATHRNFFGPVGVIDSYRGQRIGAVLTLHSLHAMRELGYAYAIIGGPSDAAPFYRKWVGAIDIPHSTPGIYVDRLSAMDLP